MRKAIKAITALMLVFIMAALPAMPFAQQLTVYAQELSLEERGFVPIRDIFQDDEDVTITWNRAERNIHIAIDGISIVLTPGSRTAYVNNTAVRMQYAIILSQGVTYIYFYDLVLVLEAFYIAHTAMANRFQLHLTEEARDMILYDLEYLVNIIRENTAWESVINRRFEFDFDDQVEHMIYRLENMHPITFRYTLEEYEELYGIAMYDVWFPIRDNDDPRYIAANYIGYFLSSGMGPFQGIGHLMPRDIRMYRIQYSGWRIFYHQHGLDRNADPSGALRFDYYTHPDVRWFYGAVDVDLNAEMTSVFPEIPGNIVTEIIIPGQVAYMRINSFATSAEFDDLTIAPFLESISGYSHLILDIRGNGGGFMRNFTHNIMGRLIQEPVEILSHQFFSGGDRAVEVMQAHVDSMNFIFDGITNNAVNQWYTIDIRPARQFVVEQGMTSFNPQDLLNLEYVVVERDWIFPTNDGIFFNGNVWLLVDERSASASSQATLLLMEAGLATVVGENTSGVMAAESMYVILPNTGLLFRVDLGYRTDAQGRSLEAYGIVPDIFNMEGMDALETVLELIASEEAAPGPQERHPLVGMWAWDMDDSYIYMFRPDGTGVRGFHNNRENIRWNVSGNNLFIETGHMTEHWTFTIVDGVLTIVSAQVSGLTWSYIRQ
ncbi:MAG: S41 family peptidase [Defluviitaleaceae bacterium]|nr:S41 family peptidase [Defluviitaleaceae bacterium]